MRRRRKWNSVSHARWRSCSGKCRASNTCTRRRVQGSRWSIVRFLVGEDEERALVRLNQKLQANVDRIPPGASPPIVKPRSIDDVPIVAVTLWGEGYDDHRLRGVAAQLRESFAEVPDVSEVTVLGGRPREVGVTLDPARLSAAAIDPLELSRSDRTGERARDRRGASVCRRRVTSRSRSGTSKPSVPCATSSCRRRGSARYGWVTSPWSPMATRRPRRTSGSTRERARIPRSRSRWPSARARTPSRSPTSSRRSWPPCGRCSCPANLHVTIDEELRRDGRREVERAPVSHVPRRRVRLAARRAGTRPAGGRRGARGHSGHARPHAVRLLGLRLHPEPHHAVRLDLLHRDPRRRRHRRGGEHRPSRADAAGGATSGLVATAVARGRRSREPDDPGHADGGRGDSADGLRRRSHGALHAPDSRGRVRGDAVLAGGGVHRDAVGRRSAASGGGRSRPRPGRRGDAALPPRDGPSHRRPPGAARVSRGRVPPVARVGRPRAAEARHRQDAAVRQQERVPGDRRHAGRHGARTDGSGVGGPRPRSAERPDRRQRAELRRPVIAVQLQRPGSPLLPPTRTASRRPAGQSAAEGRAARAEP